MATKPKRMNCVPCKQLIDCGALIVAADQYAETPGVPAPAALAAKGMARYIERYIAAYEKMDEKGLTKEYEAEAAEYSQQACDFALRLDAYRAAHAADPNVTDSEPAPTAEEFDGYKHELLELGQKIAGYGTGES